MKSPLLAVCSLVVLAFAHAAMADPDTDEANRQRQMASMQAEAARNDRANADRSFAQQQSDANAARSSSSGSSTSSSSSSSGSSGGASGLGAAGAYVDHGPQSVVDSYTIVIRTQETPPQMLARLAREADAGDTAAQYNLGRIYYTGFNDAPRDDVRARSYFQQAAEAGHAPSQANFGYFLTEGIGGPANPAEGARWLKTAADAGNSFGQAQYGMSLVLDDAAAAARYLIPAADAGEVTAQAMMGTFYAMGEGVARDDTLAIQYLKAASDQGETESTGLLAGMYLTDRGGTKAEGLQLLRQAAEAGDPVSQRNYGLVLVQGVDLPKDEVAGAAMVRRAAFSGDNPARTLLGHIYNEGLGVPQSDADAIYWWNLAAENGDEEGLSVMAQIRAGGDEVGRPPTQGTGLVAVGGAEPESASVSASAAGPTAESPAPGQTMRGELSASDPKLPDGSFYDCQMLPTQTGMIYPVSMRADSFDAYLAVGPGECGGQATMFNDDGGGGTNAALEIMGDGRPWFLRPNSVLADTTGAYTLHVGEPRRANFLVPGQPVGGDLSSSDTRLSDDSFYDCYAIQTVRDTTYQVTMRASGFDTYLGAGLGQCSGSTTFTDDDGGGGTDAMLSFNGDGQIWFVRANSLSANTTGSYTLALTQGGTGKR